MIIVPWLILLSKTVAYKWFRIFGAVLAAIAALAWIVQRTTRTANFITDLVEAAAKHGVWVIAALIVVSLVVYTATVITNKKRSLVT